MFERLEKVYKMADRASSRQTGGGKMVDKLKEE